MHLFSCSLEELLSLHLCLTAVERNPVLAEIQCVKIIESTSHNSSHHWNL